MLLQRKGIWKETEQYRQSKPISITEKNTIEDGTETTGASCFRGCTSLTSISIPDSVTTIGKYALNGCSTLSEVNIPNCSSYAYSWFMEDENLSKLVKTNHQEAVEENAIAPTYSDIGYSSGKRCSVCGEVYVEPEEIPVLKDLDVLYLPNELKTIEAEAFVGLDCEAVIIPYGCTSIGTGAFADCEKLLFVSVPATVTTSIEGVFEGCEHVTVIRESK